MPGPPRGTASRHHTTWTPLHATLQHRTKKDAPGPSIPAPACTRDEDSLTGGAAASRRVPRAPDVQSSGHVRGPSLSTKTGSPLAVPESQGLRRIPTPGPTHGCDREDIRAHPDPGIPGNCTPHTPPEIPEEGDSTTERLGGGRRCAPGPGRPPALA